MDFKAVGQEGMPWVNLAQNRNKWRALICMNTKAYNCIPRSNYFNYIRAGTCGYSEELSGSINARNFFTSFKVYWLASQEGLCSME
jgi:hypothetical protein